MDLKLRTYPDPILKTMCEPVPEVTKEIRKLAISMRDLMFVEDGLGLAAPQVGYAIRLFVVDLCNAGEFGPSLFFINPVLTPSGSLQKRFEGCLSLPGIHEAVVRQESVRVEALGLDGMPFTLNAEGLLAVAIQHENDHLDGKVLFDRMGPTTRRFAMKKLRQKG